MWIGRDIPHFVETRTWRKCNDAYSGAGTFWDAPRFFNGVYCRPLDRVEEFGLVVRESGELRGVEIGVFTYHGVGVHGLLRREGAFLPAEVEVTVDGVSVEE